MNVDQRYPEYERVVTMIADRTTGDLDGHDLELIEGALVSDPELAELALELELVATSASIAWIIEDEEERSADCSPLSCAPDSSRTARPRSIAPWVMLAAAGWSVAAMLFVGFAVSFARAINDPPPLALQRTALIQNAPDTITLNWNDWESEGAPPEIPNVQGDIVWSDSEQHGYMRFEGLPVNDPSESQYQLWIIDAERGMTQRINGGVFNCPDTGELIVEINDPDIPVSSAAAFALTIEQPGGVWVSDMSRRVVIASR